jgi:hypothetical protein
MHFLAAFAWKGFAVPEESSPIPSLAISMTGKLAGMEKQRELLVVLSLVPPFISKPSS